MKTRSVHPIARSADQAAIHPMIQKTPTTVRKASASRLLHAPLLHLARRLLPLAKSASQRKRHRQPRSAPGTVSTVQQTMNTRPHISTACITATMLDELLSLSTPPYLPAYHVRNLVSVTSTDRGSAQRTDSPCSKSLQRVPDFSLFYSLLRRSEPTFSGLSDLKTHRVVTASLRHLPSVRSMIVERSTMKAFAPLHQTVYCTVH